MKSQKQVLALARRKWGPTAYVKANRDAPTESARPAIRTRMKVLLWERDEIKRVGGSGPRVKELLGTLQDSIDSCSWRLALWPCEAGTRTKGEMFTFTSCLVKGDTWDAVYDAVEVIVIARL